MTPLFVVYKVNGLDNIEKYRYKKVQKHSILERELNFDLEGEN